MTRKLLAEMVIRSIPNINRSFFLALDKKYSDNRTWLIWAASRADAVECVDILGEWTRPTCK